MTEAEQKEPRTALAIPDESAGLDVPQVWPRLPDDPDVRRYIRAVLSAGVLSAVPYLLVLWNLSISPFRTALPQGAFSNFYDIQARALLHGHLSVAPGSLGIEGFVVRGRTFEYFPPGPALLRIPLFLVSHRFDGRLTAVSLLAAWIITTAVVALLMWRVRRIMRGSSPLGRWEAAGYGVVLAAVSCGSVLLFLGSMPWVYHEEHAWAAAMAVASSFCLLGVIERPSRGRITATGLFTLGAILTRTTTGWASVGAVLLTAMWFLTGRRGTVARQWSRRMFVAGLLPLGIGIAINWAKFRNPYLFPLQNQVWTQLNEHRRQALAAHGGTLVGPNVFLSTVVNYFRPEGIRFVRIFPFVTLPAHVARSYGGALLDQTYRTGSVPAFMPLLFILGVWGLISAFRPRGPAGAPLLRIPMLGVLAIPGGIMFYAYIAYRYTADFIPVLVFASAVGFTDLARRLAIVSRRARRGVLVAMGALACFGVVANAAAAFTTEREANPGPQLRAYISYQETVSSWTGNPIGHYVVASADLPPSGPADQLRIVGDCDAVYLGTGDPTAPWVTVDVRPVAFGVTGLDSSSVPAGATSGGQVMLAEFVGHGRLALMLERSATTSYRLNLDDGTAVVNGPWLQSPEGSSTTITIRPDVARGLYTVEAPGLSEEVPMAQLDQQWFLLPNVLKPASQTQADAQAQGLVIRRLPTAPLSSCLRLRSHAG